MLAYKKTDLGLQIALGVVCIVFLSINIYMDNYAGNFVTGKRPEIIYPFFSLAAVQLTSMLVHYFKRKTIPLSRLRKSYTILSLLALFLVMVLFAGSSFSFLSLDAAIILGVFLLISTSLLAIFYMIICWREIRDWKKAGDHEK